MAWCGRLDAFSLPNYEETQLTIDTNSVTGSVINERGSDWPPLSHYVHLFSKSNWRLVQSDILVGSYVKALSLWPFVSFYIYADVYIDARIYAR